MKLLSFKKVILAIFIILNIFVLSVFAEGETVKIGLFYGGSAREEYTVSSNSALTAGIADSGKFQGFFSINSNSVTVKADDLWHIEYDKVSSAEEAKAKADEYVAANIYAFPVYLNGEFKVWGGSFQSENDALWEAGNGTISGTAVKAQVKALSGADSQSGKIRFITEKVAFNSPDGRVKITAVAPKEYRGAMLFIPGDSGITAINVVDREEYLYSVISREMSPSWHIEALKAQAVCARNYVENNRRKHSSYGFELCDSVCCQAYAGTSSETSGSYPPVDETKGELLMYEGKVAETFYSSSMGPTTEDVKYVWGSNYPYLSSVENPYEDYENVYNGKWENTLSREKATEIMASKGYNVGDVTEIKALEYSPSGRVIKLLVKGTLGEKIFERESCRIVFSEITLSQLYTISGGGGVSYPTVSIKGSGEMITKSAEGKKILSSNGKSSIGGSFQVLGKNSKMTYTASKSSGDYVFSGMGWGHGIGMSQYGAKGMAEAGFNYKEILTHYFKGTEVVKSN